MTGLWVCLLKKIHNTRGDKLIIIVIGFRVCLVLQGAVQGFVPFFFSTTIQGESMMNCLSFQCRFS